MASESSNKFQSFSLPSMSRDDKLLSDKLQGNLSAMWKTTMSNLVKVISDNSGVLGIKLHSNKFTLLL